MTAAGAVEAGRRAAAALCLDTCTVTRVTVGTLNQSTGMHATSSATIYTGPCRIKREQARDTSAGEAPAEVARPVLVLPWTATGSAALLPGDVVTLTAAQDSALLAEPLTVVGPAHGTTSTARRYLVEEVTL